MGRALKKPLGTILRVEEVNPRDSLSLGSKAKSDAIESLTKDIKTSLQQVSQSHLKTTARGKTLDNVIGRLTIAPIPKDLPDKYQRVAKLYNYVLVDGFTRYSALESALGDDFESVTVPVNILEEGLTMGQLMEEALLLNSRHPIPLSKKQLLQQIFKTQLLKDSPEGIDKLHKKYLGVASRQTFATMLRVVRFVNSEVKPKGKGLNGVKKALLERIQQDFEDIMPIHKDAQGFPLRVTVNWWYKLISQGLLKDAKEQHQQNQNYRNELVETSTINIKKHTEYLSVSELLEIRKQLDKQIGMKRNEEAQTDKTAEFARVLSDDFHFDDLDDFTFEDTDEGF